MKDRDEGFLAPVRRVLRGEPRAAREWKPWESPVNYRWRIYWDEATRDVRVFDMGAWGRPAGERDLAEREAPVPEIPGLTYSGMKLRRVPVYIDPLATATGAIYLRRFSEPKATAPHPFDWMLGLCPWPLSEP